MSKRKNIGLKTKLCAALCQLVRYDETHAEFIKIIPYALAKRLSENEILSRFEFHHFPIPKAHDGADEHWNLIPMEKKAHRDITAKIDIPRIAKSKRIRRRAAGIKKPRTMTSWRKFDGTPVHASRTR